jgi:hypothetical protein
MASTHTILVIAFVAAVCLFPLAVSAQYNTDGYGYNTDRYGEYGTIIGIGEHSRDIR